MKLLKNFLMSLIFLFSYELGILVIYPLLPCTLIDLHTFAWQLSLVPLLILVSLVYFIYLSVVDQIEEDGHAVEDD